MPHANGSCLCLTPRACIVPRVALFAWQCWDPTSRRSLRFNSQVVWQNSNQFSLESGRPVNHNTPGTNAIPHFFGVAGGSLQSAWDPMPWRKTADMAWTTSSISSSDQGQASPIAKTSETSFSQACTQGVGLSNTCT